MSGSQILDSVITYCVMLEMPESWDTCQGEPLTEWNQLKGKNCVADNKAKWNRRCGECVLTLDMEMESLEF